MKIVKSLMFRLASIGVLAALVVSMAPAQVALAATTTEIKEAQTIANKFSMQVGTADGIFGSKTARGFCMFRHISGLTPSRAGLDSTLLAKMRAFNSQYASLQKIPSGTINNSSTYLVANQTCQMMVYSRSGFYNAVTPISTGQSGNTPTGTWYIGSTQRGWSCSTLYPESCSTHNEGRFAYISNYGNMYNKRDVSGAIKVHGSTSVPTYPASKGCVRIPISFSDWMYDNVAGNIPIRITGAY